MDHGWIVTFAVPDDPVAQISLMTEDASAPVQPDASIVDDVHAAHAAAQRLGYEIVHPLTDEPWRVRRFFVREPKRHGARHPAPRLSENRRCDSTMDR